MTAIVEQAAALPIRRAPAGGLQVLLITSRDTRRWVVPKGWLMDGKSHWETAKIEALEEAGVEGLIATEAVGEFQYDKRLEDDSTVRCRVTLYPMLVRVLKSTWMEQEERTRRWFTPQAAASVVDEPDLTALLLDMGDRRSRVPAVSNLLKAS